MRLSLPRIGIVVALSLGAVIGTAAQADADTLDRFTVSQTTVAPGATVTATTTWTSTDAYFSALMIRLPNRLGATFSSVQTVPASPCTTFLTGTLATCSWRGQSAGDRITMTATFTVPADAALGDYTLIAARMADENDPDYFDMVLRDPAPYAASHPNAGVVWGTATLTVALPTPPTTPATTPSTTPATTPATTTAAVPTAVPAGEGPGSGPAPWPVVSIFALVGVGGAVGVWSSGRRPGRYQA